MSRCEGRIEERILRIVRTHADGTLNMVYGLLGSAVESERTAEKAMRCGEVWIEIECALKFFDRFVGTPPGEGHEAQGKMRPWVAVVEFHSPGGEVCSLRDLRLHHVPPALARHQQYKGQHAVRRRIEGMTC